MDYKDIERLKLALLNLTRHGCWLKVPSYGINGRIISVGYKPYWTNPYDSKIEKLEIIVMDESGKVVPVNFSDILCYDVISNDGRGYDSMKNACIDLEIYSIKKARGEEPSEKIRIEIYTPS